MIGIVHQSRVLTSANDKSPYRPIDSTHDLHLILNYIGQNTGSALNEKKSILLYSFLLA